MRSAGSAAEAYLRRIGAQHHAPSSPRSRSCRALNQGRVKYVVEDDVMFTVFDKANPSHKIEALWGIAAPDDIIFGGGYGCARYGFRKEDCMLRTAYSVALGELRNNGTVSAILKKYGLSDRNLVWFKLNPELSPGRGRLTPRPGPPHGAVQPRGRGREPGPAARRAC